MNRENKQQGHRKIKLKFKAAKLSKAELICTDESENDCLSDFHESGL